MGLERSLGDSPGERAAAVRRARQARLLSDARTQSALLLRLILGETELP
jgi:hypothetical protein